MEKENGWLWLFLLYVNLIRFLEGEATLGGDEEELFFLFLNLFFCVKEKERRRGYCEEMDLDIFFSLRGGILILIFE